MEIAENGGGATFSSKLRRFSLVFLSTFRYFPSGESSNFLFISPSHSFTSSIFAGAKVTFFRFCSTHRALSSTRSKSTFTIPCSFPEPGPLGLELEAFRLLRSRTTTGTTISGNPMLPCTGSLPSHSVSKNAASSVKPSDSTRVFAYCWGTLIWTSNSNGLRVEGFGRDDGVKHVVRIGTMYVERGMYVCVCLERFSSERIIWRWKGCERPLGTSLIADSNN